MSARRLGWLFWAMAGASYAYLIFGPGAALIAAAGGALPFDLRIEGVTFEEAEAYMAALGEAGRQIYIDRVWLADTIFPLLLGLALAYIARMQLGRIGVGVFLALCYTGADLLENKAILGLMSGDVTLDVPALAWLQMLTRAKFVFLVVALGLIAVRAWQRRGGDA